MTTYSYEAEIKMVKLFNIYNDLSKKPYAYYPGIDLLASEVHALEHLHQCNTPCKMTDIALALGVTKGAVSKMAVKLEEMQVIRRYKYLSNQKEVYMELTELGVQVLESHSAYHQPMRAALNKFFSEMNSNEADAVMRFLTLYFEEMKTLGKAKTEP